MDYEIERGIGTQRVRERDTVRVTDYEIETLTDSLREILRDYKSVCEKRGSERYFD